MQQSKLLELVRQLGTRQLSRYEAFLLSPYFNRNQDHLLFFRYLKQYAPKFNHKNLEKKIVLDKLKISRKLNPKSLAYLMSEQVNLLEQFLAVEHFLLNLPEQFLALLDHFHDFGLDKHYQSVLNKADRHFTGKLVRNAEYFRQQLIFRNRQYEHAGTDLSGVEKNLVKAAGTLDIYFIVEKLRYACAIENMNAILNTRHEVTFIEQVLDWSEKPAFREVTAIEIYRRIYLLFRDPVHTGDFTAIRDLLHRHEQQFDKAEVKQLYTLLLNYCTRRINRYNDEKFLYEYLEINKLLLAADLLLESGHLPPWRYANLVTVGLKTGQNEWTESFIHGYKDKLPEEHAENMYRYNLAHYYYHNRQPDLAQRELIRVEFTDVSLNVAARSLLIKIYYETGQEELLHAYLEATRIFLLRNRSLDNRLKGQMKKFVEYCGKLAKTPGYERERISDLIATLPPAHEVMHRAWLADQMRERLA